MLQHQSLSEATRQIIAKLKGIMSIEALIASLYALRPEAEPQFVQALSGQIIVLSEYLSVSEIATLQAEFPSLMSGEAWDDAMRELADRRVELAPELAELCTYLVRPKQGDSLYFPYAANGSFLLHLGLDKVGKGFETNEVLWALCQIRLKTLGSTTEVSLGRTELKGERYDCIFVPIKFPQGHTADAHFAEELTNLFTEHLCEGGRMACVVQPGIAFSSARHWVALRQSIVRCGLSTTLISLPPGLMAPYTGIGVCVLLLENDGRGQITLVDARDSRFVAKHRSGYKLLLEELWTLLRSADGDKTWSGTSAELNDRSSFWPGDYLSICCRSMLQAGEEFYPLGDLVEVLKTQAHISSESLPRLVRFSDLKDSFWGCDIEAETLPRGERPLHRLLTEDCLLLAYLNGQTRVARLVGVSPECPVALGTNIYPVRITQPTMITTDYLLRAFVSELSIKQANCRANQGLCLSLSQAELLNLQIIVPDSLTRQSELCHDDMVRAIRQAGLDITLCHDEFRRDMHLKKHAIGQSLFNLNNWWVLLKTAHERGSIDVAKPLSPASRYTIADALEQLDTIITKLGVQLSRFDVGYGFAQTEFELFPFLSHYVREHHSPLYEIDLVATEVQHQRLTIRFAEDALSRVLDNILSNAATHGFAGQAEPGNRVRIELSVSGTDCIVSVSNNGLPLAEDFSGEDVFRYGCSTGDGQQHYGIGGYEMARLMQEFGAEIELHTMPHSDYPLEYRLIFRNTKLL